MKKDRAREIVQRRARSKIAGCSTHLLSEAIWWFRKGCQSTRFGATRRERKPVSVEPKRMYGRWVW